jgi:hypothetical protein
LVISQPGVSVALKLFFSVIELLVIGAGIYLFRQREKLLGIRGRKETPTRQQTFGWLWLF